MAVKNINDPARQREEAHRHVAIAQIMTATHAREFIRNSNEIHLCHFHR